MNKAIKTEKKFEFFLGLIFLIPPILGVLFFIFNLFDWSDGNIVEMRHLGGEWEAQYCDDGGATPPSPNLSRFNGYCWCAACQEQP